MAKKRYLKKRKKEKEKEKEKEKRVSQQNSWYRMGYIIYLNMVNVIAKAW